MTRRLLLVPLDERPVNTRYPQMLAKIAGADLVLPPVDIRGDLKKPADLHALWAWLRETAPKVDTAVISTDMAGYGNLISSRITSEPSCEILSRLNGLKDLPCPVYAFSVLTRIPNANDCVEEPLYWCEYGKKFAAYSKLVHMCASGGDHPELKRLRRELPEELRADWLTRRLRNHAVILGVIEMAARDDVASLSITSDDTAKWGLSTREGDWLDSWIRLDFARLGSKVRMYPGADEVGSALVARVLARGRRFHARIAYAVSEHANLIAPYEDRRVHETVVAQLDACGCEVVGDRDKCDFVLAVATPSPRLCDWRAEFLESDREQRGAVYSRFLAALGSTAGQGVPVALADVAYPNGADPVLAERLFTSNSPMSPNDLIAYGAWNTAGNTIGVVVAQAVCSLVGPSNPDADNARRLFLAHRFIEDYVYQSIVRRQARAHAQELWGCGDPSPKDPNEIAEITGWVESRLLEELSRLQGIGIAPRVRMTPGSTRLPWRRLFEVDFDLEAAPV